MAKQSGGLKDRAFFITIEGLEGSGKSSIIKKLKNYLMRKGYRVAIFREPGDTKIGEKIRKLLLDNKNKEMSPYTELLLYLAARTQLIEEKLNKAFYNYDFIISDRFFDSTLVYQGYGLGLGKIAEDSVEMFRLGVSPDLTIVLDTEVKVCLDRIKTKDRIESRSLSFHQRLRRGYKELVKRYPKRLHLVNANGDLEDIFKQVKELLKNSLWKKKRKRL